MTQTAERTDERLADVGRGITLCYDQFGSPGDEPLLLVMGLGTQMIGWPEEFCALLASRGFHVTRFDNRDIGRSTKVRGRPPGLVDLATRRRSAAHYLLSDMADDAVGLMDAVGWPSAHVVGASMGGMIAQTMAIRHPDRVRTLCSIMSNTGSRWSGQPAPAIYKFFLSRPPRDRDAAVERMVRMFAAIGSPGFDRDEAELREVIARSIERSGGSGDQAGTGRQLMAVLASGDRTRELARVAAPTLVLHGDADKLVAPSGGRATAKAIPGAKLVEVGGMGHDLPRGAWPQLADAIVDNTRRG